MDQNEMLARITQANRRDVMQLLNFLNFEIEYILRPRSAPARYRICQFSMCIKIWVMINLFKNKKSKSGVDTILLIFDFTEVLLGYELTDELKVLKEGLQVKMVEELIVGILL